MILESISNTKIAEYYGEAVIIYATNLLNNVTHLSSVPTSSPTQALVVAVERLLVSTIAAMLGVAVLIVTWKKSHFISRPY